GSLFSQTPTGPLQEQPRDSCGTARRQCQERNAAFCFSCGACADRPPCARQQELLGAISLFQLQAGTRPCQPLTVPLIFAAASPASSVGRSVEQPVFLLCPSLTFAPFRVPLSEPRLHGF